MLVSVGKATPPPDQKDASMPLLIETERLILRAWRDNDVEPYNAMYNDPIVGEYFPNSQTLEDSADFIAFCRAHDSTHGYCFQPMVEKDTGAFVGDIGLAVIEFDGPIKGQTEIGWMMNREFWGRGYATEMAQALIQRGFSDFGLPEILAFTVLANHKSRAVMERLGMERDEAGDFDHPNVLEGHPLRPHILYRKRRA